MRGGTFGTCAAPRAIGRRDYPTAIGLGPRQAAQGARPRRSFWAAVVIVCIAHGKTHKTANVALMKRTDISLQGISESHAANLFVEVNPLETLAKLEAAESTSPEHGRAHCRLLILNFSPPRSAHRKMTGGMSAFRFTAGNGVSTFAQRATPQPGFRWSWLERWLKQRAPALRVSRPRIRRPHPKSFLGGARRVQQPCGQW